MKIIYLSGDRHCGKTTTLSRLYDEMTKNMKTKPKKNIENPKMKKDFYSVFTYKKKIIVIVTFGDALVTILRMIFMYSYVDYLIIAFSKKGSTSLKVLRLIQNYKHNIHIKKTVCKKGVSKDVQEKANLLDCKKIIKAIK
jgi:hypothetical protein